MMNGRIKNLIGLILIVAAIVIPLQLIDTPLFSHGTAYAAWTTQRISDANTSTSEAPAIVTDLNGNIHAVWQDKKDGSYEIYYKKFTRSTGSWGPEVRLSENDGKDSIDPSIAVSGSYVHVAWTDYKYMPSNIEVFWNRSSNSGDTWAPVIQNVSEDPVISSQPSIAADPFGNVYVVWADFVNIHIRKGTSNGDSWQTGTMVTTWGYYEDQYWYSIFSSPKIISDSNGNLHLLANFDYWEWDSGGYYLYYRRSTDGGSSWGSDYSFSGEYNTGSLTSDSANNIYVAYGAVSAIVYNKSTNNGISWGPSGIIATPNAPWTSYYPVGVTSAGSVIHAVWQEYLTATNFDIYYSKSTDGGTTWAPKTNMSNNATLSENPSVAADPLGFAHIVWNDKISGNNEVFYATDMPSTYSISGAVTLQGQTDNSGVTVTDGVRSAVTDVNGNYIILNVPSGNYTLSASKSGYTISPSNFSNPVNVSSSALTNKNFSGTSLTHSISGEVALQGQTDHSGVTVTDGVRSAVTDVNGNYIILNVPSGSYTLSASKSGYTISPSNFSNPVTVGSLDITDKNFSGTHFYSVSGQVNGLPVGESVMLALASVPVQRITVSNGPFTFSNVEPGTHTITPAKADGYTVTPESVTVTVEAADIPGIVFIYSRLIIDAAGGAYNHPNPFNPDKGESTIYEFKLNSPTRVGVYIFDLGGRLVWRQEKTLSTGVVAWDGHDFLGRAAANGVYLVRVVNLDGNKLIGKCKTFVVK